jgi:PTH1 family peptidyl-tRNA hydrolase
LHHVEGAKRQSLSDMRLVVGLGNPGRRYVHSPHNIGYEVTDLLARRWNAPFKSSRKFVARIGECVCEDRRVLLLQPTTFMNASGEAVAACTRYYEIPAHDILVIVDDVNLPMGSLRIRARGSDGGHKGLLSIITLLGSSNFPRLRIGMQPEDEVYDWTAFVLTPLAGGERQIMQKMIEVAADAVEVIVREGLSRAMARFNGLKLESLEP